MLNRTQEEMLITSHTNSLHTGNIRTWIGSEVKEPANVKHSRSLSAGSVKLKNIVESLRTMRLKVPSIDIERSVEASITHPAGGLVAVSTDDADRAEWEGSGLFDNTKTRRFSSGGPHFSLEDFGQLPGAKKGASERFREAIDGLEKMGYGFRIDSGPKDYFVINRNGCETAITIRFRRTENERRKAIKAEHRRFLIECPCCHEVLLQTTEDYDPDVQTTGAMLVNYGPAADGNWSREYGDEDFGTSIVCVSCSAPLLDPVTGKLEPKYLDPIKD
ncbi:hypothetical protein [Desulfofustis limnaeus]|uniref:Uncharacterized protein n=1 Tax=Desulfofustis limnaeus TaxID=2740163 RepID=A0ABM7WAN9_9BACT|nr:hypothetical protein [Desulfofustis limnaeus]BDD88010.1 hypothetical protein DPPLL_23750 [Desulfofustis limnaeus]